MVLLVLEKSAGLIAVWAHKVKKSVDIVILMYYTLGYRGGQLDATNRRGL